MFYYEVWVRSIRYKGSKPLTYSFPNKLATGQIVEVQLQKETVLGVVSSTVLKPRFKVKDITKVLELPPLPPEQIKLMEWIVEFYPSSVGEASRLILPSKIPKKLVFPERGSSTLAHEIPKLTDDQEKVVSSITDNDTYLLHGRTGSGKTRIYIEIAREKIEDGRSSIILTPEISLTSQLYLNFQKQFGDQVILMHSKQTDKERFQSWLYILSSDRPVIVIGPRSALFSPISNLGLIVVDESHESSYKQDQQPYYLTNRVASYLNKISKSVLILGSATPSISDYFLAKQKNKKILEMKKTAIDSSDKDTVVEIIDLKDKSNFTKSKHPWPPC